MELYQLLAQQPVEEFMELQKLYNDEMQELTKRKIKIILEQQFKLETLGDLHSGLNQIIKSNSGKLKEQNARINNNGWVFITVNPKPDVSFDKFVQKVTKLVNRKMWQYVEYAYEQRSDDAENVHGYHVHILCRRNLNYKPSKCIKNTRNTFKGIVGNINNNQQLNC